MPNITAKGLECHAVDVQLRVITEGVPQSQDAVRKKHDRGNPSIFRQHNLLIDWHTIIDGVKMEVCN